MQHVYGMGVTILHVLQNLNSQHPNWDWQRRLASPASLMMKHSAWPKLTFAFGTVDCEAALSSSFPSSRKSVRQKG